jgi:hypothetical protein
MPSKKTVPKATAASSAPKRPGADDYKEVYGWAHASIVLRLSVFSLCLFLGFHALLFNFDGNKLSVRTVPGRWRHAALSMLGFFWERPPGRGNLGSFPPKTSCPLLLA